ncbi:MAG: LON peptidase substrate-binding domain-containing protein [Caldilineaceae bacterium]
MEMPLFPLNVVLFPGMFLPLHIFEPRYREMVEHCVETKSPFGVALIRDGQEVGDAATPCDIGTAARIAKVQRMPDGRMNISTVGTQRFRIESVDYSRSYAVAQVRHYPIVKHGHPVSGRTHATRAAQGLCVHGDVGEGHAAEAEPESTASARPQDAGLHGRHCAAGEQ